MILGISASARLNAHTARAVKIALEASEQEYEFISLSGKKIAGCIGCTGCAKDNICVVKDDFIEIAEKLRKADAIVFGAPNYYGMLNGLAHCFWERCFCFRHRDVHKLAGKLAVLLGVAHAPEQCDNVLNGLSTFTSSNYISVIGKVSVSGYSQCYTCGYGATCASGSVVRKHNFIDEILPCHLPPPLEELSNEVLELTKAGKLLGSIVTAKRKSRLTACREL